MHCKTIGSCWFKSSKLFIDRIPLKTFYQLLPYMVWTIYQKQKTSLSMVYGTSLLPLVLHLPSWWATGLQQTGEQILHPLLWPKFLLKASFFQQSLFVPSLVLSSEPTQISQMTHKRGNLVFPISMLKMLLKIVVLRRIIKTQGKYVMEHRFVPIYNYYFNTWYNFELE